MFLNRYLPILKCTSLVCMVGCSLASENQFAVIESGVQNM